MANSLERFWEDFLLFIEERRVIPVIGPELVTIRDRDQDVPLYRWIAQRLAPVLELPTTELPEGFDLNDVVSLHLRRRGDREELYPRVFSIRRGATLTHRRSRSGRSPASRASTCSSR